MRAIQKWWLGCKIPTNQQHNMLEQSGAHQVGFDEKYTCLSGSMIFSPTTILLELSCCWGWHSSFFSLVGMLHLPAWLSSLQQLSTYCQHHGYDPLAATSSCYVLLNNWWLGGVTGFVVASHRNAYLINPQPKCKINPRVVQPKGCFIGIR